MCIINLFDSPGDFISTVVIILTLIVLVFYTIATFGLRKTAIKQTELSVRPFIVIDVFKDSAGLSQRLVYKNIGHGPAIDIQTEPFDKETYFLKFNSYGLIEIGETKNLNPRGEGKDTLSNGLIQSVQTPGFTPKDLDERDSSLDLVLTIHYKNIEKVAYKTKVKINRNGISIQETGNA